MASLVDAHPSGGSALSDARLSTRVFALPRAEALRACQSYDESVDSHSETPAEQSPGRPPCRPFSGEVGRHVGGEIHQEDDDHRNREHACMEVEGSTLPHVQLSVVRALIARCPGRRW